MRKKIGVDYLEPGMFLEQICGTWIENPFWRSQFIISDPRDIAMLRASKVREVWIDTSKGSDIWPETAVSELRAEDGISASAAGWRDTQQNVGHGMFAGSASRAPIPIAEELERAAQICAAGKAAVTTMFQEARMGNTVDAAGVADLVEEISNSVARNTSALISLARLKTVDDYTYMHSVAVCAMMIALARQLNLSDAEVRSAGIAGLLHDVGKMLVPLEILNKPGKLTDAEFTLVKDHPAKGHAFLVESRNIDPIALDLCLHHHEKMDGSGYPKGLKGDAISLYAKMGAVCDVYDAITSNRPYKAGWDPSESLR
ncbi:MAG: HD-GYP domain-containing protein, partial [Betaproteobacteria bacterium]